MGDEDEYFLCHTENPLKISEQLSVFLHPIISVKIKYFVGLPESQLHPIHQVDPCLSKFCLLFYCYYCETIIEFYYFPAVVIPTARRNTLLLTEHVFT